MNKLIVIENTGVRQDAFGRYCLNDLHKAAGGLEKDKPKFWLDNEKNRKLNCSICKRGWKSSLGYSRRRRARNIRC
ncbi:KilA-N domain-containing protein [Arsenophonus endosymbiont of Aleurodicus floccissimus]|uniref:KilA-N domain-containing protein n=1 Tax=Arsenophonus endosymbiont of Aleurodicus floccissimus TaxID=2152761 RepID=UPI0034E29D9A